MVPGHVCPPNTMLDRLDLEPLFFAPFVSSVMKVDPTWIDYNGHLNMAYYNVLFDRAVDEAYELLGIGLDYVKKRRHSLYTAELHAGDPVRVTFQLLGYDKKRVHYFEQLIQTAENAVSATSENLALHVDMDGKRSALFPQSVLDRLEKMSDSHARLPRPAAAGRSVGLKTG